MITETGALLSHVSLTLSAAAAILSPSDKTEMDYANMCASVRAMLTALEAEVEEAAFDVAPGAPPPYDLADEDVAEQIAFTGRCYAAIAEARRRGEARTAAEWFRRARPDRLVLKGEPDGGASGIEARVVALETDAAELRREVDCIARGGDLAQARSDGQP